MAEEQNDRAGGIGIPSIPPERAAQAFAAFYLSVVVAIAIDVLMIIHNHESETRQQTTEMVFDDGGQIVAWALAATWPIMEVMRMVFATIWENRIRRRAIEQGREEANRHWREWNQRRIRAEERGEPFDKPPPDVSKSNLSKSA